tara:strand:+ start:2319 stop:2501 length:183 start_codon:yes stop_codon:yes gene_type:complete
MRNLTSKQKKILDKYKHIDSVEKLPNDVWEQLVEIHETEVLYQYTDGYLWENFHSRKELE